MIILDTCAIIYDALDPKQLSKKAQQCIEQYGKENLLYCSDISLWEIAMLIQKKRIDPGIETEAFLELILESRRLQVINITSKIAAFSAEEAWMKHFDPADRIIAATTIVHQGKLVTCDKKLQQVTDLHVIW
ncbi:MAG: type II toxin-antitoxin system VapC family toxin [Gammaproteobacteria bacterium]|nr:MAG: type II toxin-antitoxin system VapC family toxin [Gammaproteobacteria bacterium]